MTNVDPGGDMIPSPGNAQASPTPISAAASDVTQTEDPNTGASPDSNTGPLTGLTFAQVENYWIQAGGSPQSASMAAAVADAESGLNAAANRTNPDGTIGVGLWLIPQNGTPPGSTDPLANARAAIQLSQNGTDWTQWCSSWSDNNCGQDNGTYLGSGSNALMSLGTQKSGASYNVFGSTPASTGVGASTATSNTAGSSTTGNAKSNYLLYGVIVVVVIVIIWASQRKGQPTEEQPPEVEPPE
jgi:hypothetical protein